MENSVNFAVYLLSKECWFTSSLANKQAHLTGATFPNFRNVSEFDININSVQRAF